jgi:hypothetical protein
MLHLRAFEVELNKMAKRDSAGAWCAGAGYLYILDLDASDLAWEYLRRHPQYQVDWTGGAARAAPERWGLRFR